MSSCCLGRAVKRVWRGLRLRRATGLGRLRKEVRTCEYSDVHVMWEMLSTTKSGTRRAGGGGGGAAMAGKASRLGRKAAVAWRRLASYCCACAL